MVTRASVKKRMSKKDERRLHGERPMKQWKGTSTKVVDLSTGRPHAEGEGQPDQFGRINGENPIPKFDPCIICKIVITEGYYGRWGNFGTCQKTCEVVQEGKPRLFGQTPKGTRWVSKFLPPLE